MLQITYSVKNHINCYIVNLLKLFIYLQEKQILDLHQIIVRIWQSYLNTQKETIAMLSMDNFLLATLLVFIFRGTVPCYLVINKTNFFKRNSLKQHVFWSFIKILQIILLVISFCHFIDSFIYFHSFFIYVFIFLEVMQI